MLLRSAAVAAAVVGVVPLGAQATAHEPALRVVGRVPLVVIGQGFDPEARVQVRVAMGERVERRAARPDARGRFRVVFARIQLTGRWRCAVGVVIDARAAGGKLVLWRPQGLPDCPSPSRPPA
jgi:hypothetical protein